MGPLIVVELLICGICLAIGLLHGAIFIFRPERKADLYFAIMSLAAAGNAFFETSMYRAISPGDFIAAFKAHITCQGIIWIFLTWFISEYTGAARRWLTLVVSSSYALAVLVNLVSPFGIIFSGLDALQTVVLPWGETITAASGPANPWRFLSDIAWVALVYLAVESCIRMGRRGERPRALVLGISLLAFLGLAYLHGTLTDLKILGPPPLFTFTFLGLILVTSASITRDAMRTPELSREVEDNERRWRSLLENVQLIVVGLDRQGRVTYINPFFTELTEITESEIMGQDWLSHCLPSDEREKIEALYNKVPVHGVPPHYQNRILTKSGEQRMISWSNVGLYDHAGGLTGTLSVGEDITERDQAVKDLADERERMDVVLSALNTGMALINPDMTVGWVSAKIREMFPWDDPVGQKCYAFCENRTEVCEGCQSVQAFADGQVHERELLNSNNGRWYHIIALPIKDDAGQVIGVLESNTDITDFKKTVAERDQAIQGLEALKARLEAENIYLREEIENHSGFKEIVGNSNALFYVLEKVRQVAETDASVLIQGETGVGKELIARAIHQTCNRASRSFIQVNCAVLPANLIESELFGHEAGAFTGATKRRRGRFELADGGTLFLDEISELPMELQPKLLRVLQEGAFERVGGPSTLTVSVRIIAATNRDLKAEVQAGRFRADLFYRLNVFPITVPPLRRRREDIPLLVSYFIPKLAQQVGKTIDQIPPHVMEQFAAAEWPGNVRELKNVLERAVISSTGTVLSPPEGFFAKSDASLPPRDPAADEPTSLDELQRRHIIRMLQRASGRIEGAAGAAELLQINPSTLRARIKKLGITRQQYL